MDTPFSYILLGVEWDAPCMSNLSILLAVEIDPACPYCWRLKVIHPERTCILLAVEMDTPCLSIILSVGKGYTLHAHTTGGGMGYTLHVHTAVGGKGYTLHVYIAGCVQVVRPGCPRL